MGGHISSASLELMPHPGGGGATLANGVAPLTLDRSGCVPNVLRHRADLERDPELGHAIALKARLDDASGLRQTNRRRFRPGRYATAPRPGLLPPTKHQAQINRGLSLCLDDKRRLRQFKYLKTAPGQLPPPLGAIRRHGRSLRREGLTPRVLATRVATAIWIGIRPAWCPLMTPPMIESGGTISGTIEKAGTPMLRLRLCRRLVP